MLQAPKDDTDYRPRIAVLNTQQRKAREGACIAVSGSGKSGRRPPHKTTEAQKRVLLAEFEHNPSPQAKERERIARILNVERRIVKNWFSNQRAFRRKTGQGYPGCSFGPESSVSGSPGRSDDEWEGEGGRKAKDVPRQDDTDAEMDGDADETRPAPTPTPAPVYPVLRTTTNAYTAPGVPARQHNAPAKKVLGLTPELGNVLPPISHILDSAPKPPAIAPFFPLRSAHPSVAIPQPYFDIHGVPHFVPPRLQERPLPLTRYPESAERSSLTVSGGIVSVS